MQISRTGNRYSISRIAGGAQHNFLRLDFEPGVQPFSKITAHRDSTPPRGLTDESVTLAVRNAFEIASLKYPNLPIPTGIEYCDSDYPHPEILEWLAGIVFQNIGESTFIEDGESRSV